MGEMGDFWVFGWEHGKFLGQNPKKCTFCGDILGEGRAKAIFPIWQQGEMGENVGSWQCLMIVAPHFSHKNFYYRKFFQPKIFPTLCPHVDPEMAGARKPFLIFIPMLRTPEAVGVI